MQEASRPLSHNHVGRRRRLLIALAVLTVAGASATVAYATGLIGGDSTINACVRKGDGSIRIVSSPDACSAHEEPLSWSQGSNPAAPDPSGNKKKATGAYAHFENGILDQGRSLGIVQVQRYFDPNSGLGTYCIVLNFTPKTVSTGTSFASITTSLGSLIPIPSEAPAVVLAGMSGMALTPCPSASAAVRVLEKDGTADFFVSFA